MPYGTVNADVIQSSVSGVSLGAGNASIMKNRIINGAMVIDQRNAGAAINPVPASTQTFAVDRMPIYITQANKLSAQQNAGSVTPPVGFTNYLGVTSLSAYSVVSSDITNIYPRIEGYNVADLGWGTANAKTVTLSFWVYSSLTGTFGVCLQNNAQSRAFATTYTISAANTWEYKTITIAGDTSGTWLTNNSIGISVNFGLGNGSTYTVPSNNVWTAGQYFGAVGATSILATSGATFYITGVQLEVGSSATGFEYRQYQQELSLCQRYYQCIGGAFNGSVGYQYYALGYSGSTTQAICLTPFITTMRSAPSFTVINPTNYYIYSSGGAQNTTSITIDVASPCNIGFNAIAASGLVAGQAIRLIQNGANATQMQFSAEL